MLTIRLGRRKQIPIMPVGLSTFPFKLDVIRESRSVKLVVLIAGLSSWHRP